MDNNMAERAIRPFTVDRKNWGNADSIRGAEGSAIMYSLVETAKANGLQGYNYLEYVLTELAPHQDDTDRAFFGPFLYFCNQSIQFFLIVLSILRYLSISFINICFVKLLSKYLLLFSAINFKSDCIISVTI